MSATYNESLWEGCPREVWQARKYPEKLQGLVKKYQYWIVKLPNLDIPYYHNVVNRLKGYLAALAHVKQIHQIAEVEVPKRVKQIKLNIKGVRDNCYWDKTERFWFLYRDRAHLAVNKSQILDKRTGNLKSILDVKSEHAPAMVMQVEPLYILNLKLEMVRKLIAKVQGFAAKENIRIPGVPTWLANWQPPDAWTDWLWKGQQAVGDRLWQRHAEEKYRVIETPNYDAYHRQVYNDITGS